MMKPYFNLRLHFKFVTCRLSICVSHCMRPDFVIWNFTKPSFILQFIFVILILQVRVMRFLAIISFLLASAYAVDLYEILFAKEWQSWKTFHGKSYDSHQEETFRMKVFVENSRLIAKHNSEFARGLHSYTLKMNMFGDMLPWEIKGKFFSKII